jgi:hypothetical protein
VGQENTWYVLPSRRFFSPYFGNSNEMDRSSFISSSPQPTTRQSELTYFTNRLVRAFRNRTIFDPILAELFGRNVDWSIDQADQGQSFIKFRFGNAFHSSDGAGDGLVGALFLVDAVYDSRAGDIIVIDEPELSMHPALQRRAFSLLKRLSADRQIILSTHSQYFVPEAIDCSAIRIARVSHELGGIRIYQPSSSTLTELAQMAGNLNNPHVFGLDAREVLFNEDGLILVEGQEDVVSYRLIAKQLNHDLRDSFWGWGVGGAGNMPRIAKLLHELGMKRVVGILDGNMTSLASGLRASYPGFKFMTIPAQDIRTKAAEPARSRRDGILDATSRIHPQFVAPMTAIYDEAKSYLDGA